MLLLQALGVDTEEDVQLLANYFTALEAEEDEATLREVDDLQEVEDAAKPSTEVDYRLLLWAQL